MTRDLSSSYCRFFFSLFFLGWKLMTSFKLYCIKDTVIQWWWIKCLYKYDKMFCHIVTIAILSNADVAFGPLSMLFFVSLSISFSTTSSSPLCETKVPFQAKFSTAHSIWHTGKLNFTNINSLQHHIYREKLWWRSKNEWMKIYAILQKHYNLNFSSYISTLYKAENWSKSCWVKWRPQYKIYIWIWNHHKN